MQYLVSEVSIQCQLSHLLHTTQHWGHDPCHWKITQHTDKKERVKTPFLVQHYNRRNLFWRKFFMPVKLRQKEKKTKTSTTKKHLREVCVLQKWTPPPLAQLYLQMFLVLLTIELLTKYQAYTLWNWG